MTSYIETKILDKENNLIIIKEEIIVSGQINLQDKFLNQARRKDIKVTIFLVNGVRLTGHIEGFDNFTVVVQTDKGQQLVYKHAISTVVPAKEINNLFEEE